MNRKRISLLAVVSFLLLSPFLWADCVIPRQIFVANATQLASALEQARPCDKIELRHGIYDMSDWNHTGDLSLPNNVTIRGAGRYDSIVTEITPITIQASNLIVEDVTLTTRFRTDLRFLGSANRFRHVWFRGIGSSGSWGSRYKFEGTKNLISSCYFSDMGALILGNGNILERTIVTSAVDRSGFQRPLLIEGNNNLLRNVTVAASGGGTPRALSLSGSRNVIVNSILQAINPFFPEINGTAISVQAGSLNTISYSLVHVNGEEPFEIAPGAGLTVEETVLIGDPLFADPEVGDYHIRLGSPAIDTGTPNQLDPNGTPADLGAIALTL